MHGYHAIGDPLNVRGKLLVMIGFAAAVPLSISAHQSLGIHQAALAQAHTELHDASARFAAKVVSQRLEHSLDTLRGLVREGVDWASLSEAERSGAMWLVYAQVKLGVVVSLQNAQNQELGPGAFLRARSPDYPDRVALAEADLAAFSEHTPHKEALTRDEVVGPVYEFEGRTVLPIAFGVRGRAGERWVLGVGLLLNSLCAELASASGEQQILLYDQQQRSICADGTRTPLTDAPPSLRNLLDGSGSSFRYERIRNGETEVMLAADALAFSGWHVVAQQLAAVVHAPGERIRLRSLIWLGVGVFGALAGGLVLAQSILKPLRQLSWGAQRAAASDFDFQLNARETDELGQLARSFDHMLSELRKRDAEIRSFNDELQQRVSERTHQLKRANDALLEARTIAAMASLGSGIAHEINNPLTGVIGLTQVLLARARKVEQSGDIAALESIEKEAKRIQELVHKMAQLSESHGDAPMVEVSGRQLLRAVLTAEKRRLESAGIGVVEEFSAGASAVLGNPYQLGELFQRVIDNAANAMARHGGTLTVRSRKLDEAWTEFTIEDTGQGIRQEYLAKVFEPFFTTKDSWHGEGLGLTLAYRIVEAHGGEIELHSEWQQGTRVVVRLPAARIGALLV